MGRAADHRGGVPAELTADDWFALLARPIQSSLPDEELEQMWHAAVTGS